MTDYLIVMLAEGGSEIAAVGTVSEGAVSPVWQQSVADNYNQQAYAGVIAVCSGVDVSVWQQALPDMPHGKLLKIIPTIMADSIATDIASKHFAIWDTASTENENKLVAVTEETLMKTALATCAAVGLQCDKIIPDFMMLMPAENSSVVYKKDGLTLVRNADETGYAAESDVAAHMIVGDTKELTEPEFLQCVVNVPVQNYSLLQGAYAPTASIIAILQIFKRASILLFALFAVWLFVVFAEMNDRSDRADELYGKAETEFRAAFPNVRRIVNIEAQARQELARLGDGGGAEFLSLSQPVFLAVKESEAALLEGLRYEAENNEIIATFSFADFAEAESFKQALISKGLSVSEGSSRQEASRIFTDISIRKAR